MKYKTMTILIRYQFFSNFSFVQVIVPLSILIVLLDLDI